MALNIYVLINPNINNMNIIKQKIKIVAVLLFAVFLANRLSATFFIANTPRVNIAYIKVLPQLPMAYLQKTQTYLAGLFNRPYIPDDIKQQMAKVDEFNKLPTNLMKQISKGTYAAEDSKTNVLYIRLNGDVPSESKVVTLDGVKTTVKFIK